jgi:hypothetical protein
MIWNPKCHRVKALLALWIGHDLSENGQEEARAHLAQCACCRSHWQKLQAGQRVLEQTRVLPVSPTGGDSLWPLLQAQMNARRRSLSRSPDWINLNAWLPIGALAAACLAILVSAQTTPLNNEDGGDRHARVNRPNDLTFPVQYRVPYRFPWVDQPAIQLRPRQFSRQRDSAPFVPFAEPGDL